MLVFMLVLVVILLFRECFLVSGGASVGVGNGQFQLVALDNARAIDIDMHMEAVDVKHTDVLAVGHRFAHLNLSI